MQRLRMLEALPSIPYESSWPGKKNRYKLFL
jgi:hypothetical protein